MNESFQSWQSYWGLLYEDRDDRFPSRVYGFENLISGRMGSGTITTDGGCFGFVSAGKAGVFDECHPIVEVCAGQWFTTANGCTVTVSTAHTAVFVAQRVGYRGCYSVGGPIESKGRLRYIDGCSDSLLACPPLLGDPCLNHLHFPGGIDQTEHTHPSLRAGIIARGRGYCVTTGGVTPLVPHLIFVIPTDGLHKFRTDDDVSMDVVPYHPDSDWGPTHEEHPMVNRTLVAGMKIDNTQGAHAGAELAGSTL